MAKNKAKVLACLDIMNIIFSSDDETNNNKNIKKRKKRQYWVRPYYLERNRSGAFNSVFTELLQDPKLFQSYTRMTFANFYELLAMVEPLITKQSVVREPLSSNLRLFVTLRYLATGESQTSLAIAFKCSQTSIHRIVSETTKSIKAVLKDNVFPKLSAEYFESVASGFSQRWNFPHCIGAIDGKHVTIQAPKNSGSEFYNYKKTSSIVLMAIADDKYNFMWCNVGAAGRQSDGGVFRESRLGKCFYDKTLPLPKPSNVTANFKNVPYVFVADDAFAMTENMLKPFIKTPSNREKIFNYRLSRARRIIENCFGILAAKWRIFRTRIIADVGLVEDIIQSSVCLHNWLHQKNENFISADLVDCEVGGESVQGSVNAQSNFLPLQTMNRNSTNAAKEIRNRFADYFVGEGQVEWQLSKI